MCVAVTESKKKKKSWETRCFHSGWTDPFMFSLPVDLLHLVCLQCIAPSVCKLQLKLFDFQKEKINFTADKGPLYHESAPGKQNNYLLSPTMSAFKSFKLEWHPVMCGSDATCSHHNKDPDIPEKTPCIHDTTLSSSTVAPRSAYFLSPPHTWSALGLSALESNEATLHSSRTHAQHSKVSQ